MFVDLAGQSVTQAMATCKEAVAACEDPELELRVDSEVIKLNLYNHLHKQGLRCKLTRKGPYHHLTVKLARKSRRDENPPETMAFPIGHLSGEKAADTTPPKTRRRRARKAQEPQEPQEQAPNPTPVQAEQPKPIRTAPARPNRDLQGAPKPAEIGLGWLVIQTDQIGQRDVQLGVELMEDLIDNLDIRTIVGVFLIHRGVRLLDSSYQEGRVLNALLRRNLKIRACGKSLGYYQLLDKLDDLPVEVVPPHDVLKLAVEHKLTWL